MTETQLSNILKIMGNKNYEKKETVVKILEDKLDTTKLDFSQNRAEKDRVVFVYEGHKYRLAINSKGLLNNFIECMNFSNIIADSETHSINPYNFLAELKSFNSDDSNYNLCTKGFVMSSLRRKEDFKLIKSTTSDIITFDSIRHDSRLYFYFKVFVELSKKVLIIDSIDSSDFYFNRNPFRLNNFLNVYPKSLIKSFNINFELEKFLFELEEFLNKPQVRFFNQSEYKAIFSCYESAFNKLNEDNNYNDNYNNNLLEKFYNDSLEDEEYSSNFM